MNPNPNVVFIQNLTVAQMRAFNLDQVNQHIGLALAFTPV